MSVIVNDRDVRLRATSDRTTPAQDRVLLLVASANVIRTAPGGGSPLPAVVTITAVPLNMTGNVTWSAVPALDMTVSGNTLLIAASAFGSNQSVIVTAKIVREGVTYEAKQTVVKVSDGASGTPVYTWIKYADSATGSGISDSPDGKTYIGLAYNKSTPIESDLPGDYTWSLFRGEQGPEGPQGAQGFRGAQGPQGAQGIPGPVGPDGRPTYTWIAYSDSPNGANMYQVPTATTTYIGIVPNRATDIESTNPDDYVWSKFKGDQGVQGPRGPDGKPTYTWIKYASSAAGAGMSDDPTGKDYIGFAYNKPTDQESTTPADYTWSLIKGPQGPQGTQGVQGPVGPDGRPTYTWIAYSDSPNGANMYQIPTATTTYIGIAPNKTTDVESTNPADYAWSKFKGDQGVQGPQGPQGAEGPQGPRGPEGGRGTVDIAVAGHTAWSDSAATNAVIGAGYGYPQNRDRVTLYGSGFAQTRFYSGGSWLTIAAWINGNAVVEGTLSCAALMADVMTGQTIRTSSGTTRTVLNEGGSNALEVYVGGSKLIRIGGTSVSIANMYAQTQSSAVAAVKGDSSTIQPGIAGENTGTGRAGMFSAADGTAISAFSVRGTAMEIDGPYVQSARAESANKSTRTNNCIPVVDNAYNCGTLAARWMGITSATAVLVSSDQRMKTDVSPSSLGLDFIQALRPVSYRLKAGRNEVAQGEELAGPWPADPVPPTEVVVTPVEGKRLHYGLIAQDVRQVLLEHGADDAAFWALSDPLDPDSQQALRYEELIAPLIKAFQELYALQRAQQQSINQLQGL